MRLFPSLKGYDVVNEYILGRQRGLQPSNGVAEQLDWFPETSPNIRSQEGFG